MSRLARNCCLIGALTLMLAVMASGLARHILTTRLTANFLDLFRVALEYQYYHGMGLIFIGLLAARARRVNTLRMAAIMMIAGLLLFCGSVYAVALGGDHSIAHLAPIGGSAFMAGWALVAFALWRGDLS